MGLPIKPFETSVTKVQITCSKDAHKCTKKESWLGEFGFVMWFGTSLGLPCILPMLKVMHT
jgi:hypothetical protein